MKIQIKNRFNNLIVFEHEQENNTLKITIELAIKNKADLREADLSGADLIGANLSEDDLSNAR